MNHLESVRSCGFRLSHPVPLIVLRVCPYSRLAAATDAGIAPRGREENLPLRIYT